MSILEPFGSVVELASRLAAQKVISGEMDRFEAFEYANQLVDQMVQSDEYKMQRQRILSKLIDVKDVPFGDKVNFSTTERGK